MCGGFLCSVDYIEISLGEASHTISPRVPVSQILWHTLNITTHDHHKSPTNLQANKEQQGERERERPLPRPLFVTSYHRAYSTHAVGFMYHPSESAIEPVHDSSSLVRVKIPPAAMSSFKARTTTKRRRYSMTTSGPASHSHPPPTALSWAIVKPICHMRIGL